MIMVRTWIGALAVALIAVASAPAFTHAEHGGAHDCEVCEQITESLADLSDHIQIRPTDGRQGLLRALEVALALARHGARPPARGPPLSVFPLL